MSRVSVVAVALLAAGCAADETSSPVDGSPDVSGRGEYTVTWVSDGDTIEVEGSDETLMVRLLAINAPDKGECYADEGLDHLIDTLKGERVRLEEVSEDQFERTLAHVFVGDRHVNLEMVATGLAIASSPEEDDPYRDAVLDAEESAYVSGTGLWSAGACGGNGTTPDVDFDGRASSVDPPGPDDETLDGEAVVIVNQGDDIVDLAGWVLRDESTRHRHTFPPGTSIEPGGRLEVTSADASWDPGDSPVWNNDGDMALLQDDAGTVVARWRY